MMTTRAATSLYFLLIAITATVRGGASPQNIAPNLEKYVDALPQMPKIYAYSVQDGSPPTSISLTIGMFRKNWQFHRDMPNTTVFVYGTSRRAATFPGPTIEALQGVPLYVTWKNYLPSSHILPWDPTISVAIPNSKIGVPAAVHLHGGVVEPQSDGSAFAWYTAYYREVGPMWSQATYHYPNIQHPGNLWYHDHALGLTRENLLAGLIGAYVVRNYSAEDPFGLPSGDEFDRHLVLADRSFNCDGSIFMNRTGNNPTIHPQWNPEYFGDVITVNGKAWPYLIVSRRKYRFRILNSSNARYFNLSLSAGGAGGLPITVIGSDGTYLRNPVVTPWIVLATGEIFDVVIDFNTSNVTPSNVTMINSAPYPFPNGDTPPSNLTGQVMKFVVSQDPVTDDSQIPESLMANYPVPNVTEATVKRYIVMYEYKSITGQPTHVYINGKRLLDPPTETPLPGSTEVWEVINLTNDNHPLHLHLATFQAVKVRALLNLQTFKNCMTYKNDSALCNVTDHVGPEVLVPKHEKTWKNIVKIEPGYMTTIVVKFKLIDRDAPYPFDATAQPGYVYHCHILDHEDNEMIRPLIFRGVGSFNDELSQIKNDGEMQAVK